MERRKVKDDVRLADEGSRLQNEADATVLEELTPLRGVVIVSLATNVPGPVAASRLYQLGAEIIKIEPPSGDPLQLYSRGWYQQLVRGQEVIRLDLKCDRQRDRFDRLCTEADVLLTSMRPAALERLRLGRHNKDEQLRPLMHVAIVGFPSELASVPGHDLTYQASLGLLSPPALPKTLIADLAAAEQVVSTALALLVARANGDVRTYVEVAIASAAEIFAAPLRHGLTSPVGVLGGGFPGYGIYETSDGWIAVTALEAGFQSRLLAELKPGGCRWVEIDAVFRSRTTREWVRWAARRDLPIAPVGDTRTLSSAT